MYQTISNNVRTAWQSVRGASTPADDDDLDSAERGEASEPGEKTPLLSRRITSSSEESQPSRSNFHLPRIHVFKLLWAATLAPIYSVLIFLPMLPFWTFAGFLVYLLGTAPGDNFYVYLSALFVLVPFNIVGTTFMVRRVWLDFYGD